MGVFENSSGSLYTEQKKLGASFENMQAAVGTALLPSVVDLNKALREMLEEITPGLIAAFEGLAGVLEGIVGVFNDAMDPTTELGESFAALNIQAESLAETMGAEGFEFDAFELGALIIRSVVDFVHDLMRSLEDVIIHLQVAGIAINDFFTNREKFDNTDYVAMREELFAISDGAKAIRLESVTATDAVKAMRESVLRADEAKLNNLKDAVRSVKISVAEANAEFRRMRRQAGLPEIKDPKPDNTNKDKDTSTSGGSRRETAAEKKEREKREREKKRAEEQRRKEKEILEKRKAAFKSFQESVKQTFSQFKETILSAFDLPSLGN
jgi:hypothetical protein